MLVAGLFFTEQTCNTALKWHQGDDDQNTEVLKWSKIPRNRFQIAFSTQRRLEEGFQKVVRKVI